MRYEIQTDWQEYELENLEGCINMIKELSKNKNETQVFLLIKKPNDIYKIRLLKEIK